VASRRATVTLDVIAVVATFRSRDLFVATDLYPNAFLTRFRADIVFFDRLTVRRTTVPLFDVTVVTGFTQFHDAVAALRVIRGSTAVAALGCAAFADVDTGRPSRVVSGAPVVATSFGGATPSER
jgi:hypothetical protein